MTDDWRLWMVENQGQPIDAEQSKNIAEVLNLQSIGDVAGRYPTVAKSLVERGHVLTDPFNSGSNGGGWFSVIQQGINLAGSLLTQRPITIPTAPGGPSVQVGPVEVPIPFGNPMLQVGAKALACTVKRRRYKVIRNPDGTITAEAYCIPRRMNPLNPRALARAGRRVAAFSKIARGMQKMLEASCRKGGFKASRPRTSRCAPKCR